jgi:pectate lyase
VRRLFNPLMVVFLIAVLSSSGTLAVSDSAEAASATTCNAVSGNVGNSTNHLAGCTKSTTGGSGTLSFAQTGDKTVDTVTWKNDGTTSFVVTTRSGANRCPSDSFEVRIRSTVTKSTGAAASIKGKVFADACITGLGNVSLLTGTVWKF